MRPMAHDQPDNARRLGQLGVGLTLTPAVYREKAVVAKLTTLLSSAAVQEQCRLVAKKVDFAAALQTACDAILSQ